MPRNAVADAVARAAGGLTLAGERPVTAERWIETDVPARLDRLPWSGWHSMVVVALGITWLLDGLESNLAGTLAGVLKRPDTLGLSDAQLGLAGSIYLFGSVAGALVFGYAT